MERSEIDGSSDRVFESVSEPVKALHKTLFCEGTTRLQVPLTLELLEPKHLDELLGSPVG